MAESKCPCQNCQCEEKTSSNKSFSGWDVALALALMGYRGPRGIFAPMRHITSEDILTSEVINRQVKR